METKRRAELTLVAFLADVLPDLNFYPAKGGTDEGGSSLPKPPFGAVWIQDAEKTVAYEKTYVLTGTIVWVSRSGGTAGTDVAEHSNTVQQIYDVLNAFPPGMDEDRKLAIHGIDIATVNEFNDSERHAYGDTISFVMGVSELD